MAHSWDYFFFLLEISRLAKRVTGTASTDMSAVAPVLMLCLFLSLELLLFMAVVLSLNIRIIDIALIDASAKSNRKMICS